MLFNFGWIREGDAGGDGLPGPRRLAASWSTQGVGAVVSLTARQTAGRPGGARARDAARADPRLRHARATRSSTHTLRFIRAQIEAGRAVVVHCQAGQGRTGTRARRVPRARRAFGRRGDQPGARACVRDRSRRSSSWRSSNATHAVAAVGATGTGGSRHDARRGAARGLRGRGGAHGPRAPARPGRGRGPRDRGRGREGRRPRGASPARRGRTSWWTSPSRRARWPMRARSWRPAPTGVIGTTGFTEADLGGARPPARAGPAEV